MAPSLVHTSWANSELPVSVDWRRLLCTLVWAISKIMPAPLADRPRVWIRWVTWCMSEPRVNDGDVKLVGVLPRAPQDNEVVFVADQTNDALRPRPPRREPRRPRRIWVPDQAPLETINVEETEDQPVFLGREGPVGPRPDSDAGPAIDLTVEDSAEVHPRSTGPPGPSPQPAKRPRYKEEEFQEVVDLSDPDVRDFLEQAALAGVEVELPRPVAPQEFDCALCYDTHGVEDCFIVSMCGHKFCREGARAMVLSAIRSGEFPIACALCKARPDPPCVACEARRSRAEAVVAAGGEAPTGGLADWCCSLDADLHLLLTVEEEEEYHSRSVRAASSRVKDLVACPQPDCQGLAVAGGQDMSPRLVCNVCSHEWCGKCAVPWHTGKTCDDVERERGEEVADKSFAEFRQTTRVLDCPTCGIGITKIDGCNRVMCAGCKTNVCWLCGKALPSNHSEAYKHFTEKGPCKNKTYGQGPFLPPPPQPQR